MVRLRPRLARWPAWRTAAHRVASGGIACLTLMVGLCATPAHAFDPDDTPWTVDDADPGAQPDSIEDLLERDRRSIVQDTDIDPPGQDQPDFNAHREPGSLDTDQLMPPLPAEIHRAPDQGPQYSIRPGDPEAALAASKPVLAPAPAAATPPALHNGPAQQPTPVLPKPTARTLQPVGAAAAALTPSQLMPSATIGGNNRPPAPVAPAGAHPALPVATPKPPDLPNGPAPAIVPAQAPDHTAILHESPDPGAPPPLAVPATPVEQPAVAVNGKLYLPIKRYFDTKGATALATFDGQDRAALAAHYEKTLGEALWVTRDGFNDGARALMAQIAKADEWGLASADYKLPGLAATGVNYDYARLIEAEVGLSLVAMEYARHARGDRIDDPTQLLSSYIDRKPQIIERSKIIADLIAAPDKAAYLRSLHPKHPQFEALRRKLAELRAKKRAGAELELIPDGPKITPGKSHASIAALRRRLNTRTPGANSEGTAMDETYYDKDLAAAVIDYKRKNGIEPANSTITPALRASLNRQGRLDEEALLANMEEWRWMPEDLGETYVWVNIPEFLVRVVKQGQIIHEERIVTGRYETQTPIFSHEMKTVVFQPTWNVPESIKVNELLPELRAGRNPIAGQGLRVERNGRTVNARDVDWSRQDIRNYHIYQPPGRSNVLGVVKFLFPNKHAVYLHDTPAKKLFDQKIRTFSHGCMRVRNPLQLARVIMAEDKGWDQDKVDELIASGPEDNDVALDKPMPVHITYFTMWVNEGGDVSAFPDVYGHEKRIKLGLNGRWEEIIRNPDHLAPAEPGAVASREDWGDADDDSQRIARQARPSRYGAPTAPQRLRRGSPGYKSGTAFSDFIKNVFGAN
ncbi:MAG TPA: L,D-transpeptidase family protein [Hyphomicrobium sp.]|nr:L,D-transpeptidase family protein [Hyphomicrobium sp.]